MAHITETAMKETAIKDDKLLFSNGEEGSGRDVSPEAPPKPKL